MADERDPLDIKKETRGPLDIRKDRPNEMSVEPSRPNTDYEKLRQTLGEAGYALVPREKIVHIEKSMKYNSEAIASTRVIGFQDMLSMLSTDALKNVANHAVDYAKVTHIENADDFGTIRAKLIVIIQD